MEELATVEITSVPVQQGQVLPRAEAGLGTLGSKRDSHV